LTGFNSTATLLHGTNEMGASPKDGVMNPIPFHQLPHMLYADPQGRIFEHPYFRMAGFSGAEPAPITEGDLMELPEFSKLFFIPDCPPVGLDPETGAWEIIPHIELEGKVTPLNAVAAFLEPGLVRTHLPAADYGRKGYTLPMWAYTAVGFRHGAYWAAGFQIEKNHKWDPRNYDDRDLILAIREYERNQGTGPLVEHLKACATRNHCFAAKNLFLGRWEAPLPISRTCNAACLGCLSLQPQGSCEASHQRLSFTPSTEEVAAVAVRHLTHAPEPIVSFGQGCEGEPLTEWRLICDSIRRIREQTQEGTINLNTNGSRPEQIRKIAESGLDSIRISLNSALGERYHRYYRPKDYRFADVVASIRVCQEQGLYTMLNYLIFPGITDQADELEALGGLIDKTGINFLHLKNLCIDPAYYLQKMPGTGAAGMGIRCLVNLLQKEFPEVELGYFNQPVKRASSV